LEEYVLCPGQKLNEDTMAGGNLQEKRQFTRPSHKCTDNNKPHCTETSCVGVDLTKLSENIIQQ